MGVLLQPWAVLALAQMRLVAPLRPNGDCPTTCNCAHVEGRLTADCSSQNLTELPPGLPAKAMALLLDDNLLGHLTTPRLFASRRLTSLVTLRMSRARLSEIRPGVLDDLPILEDLDLSHNFLGDMEEPVFRTLAKLTRIDLSHNRIKEVQPRMFEGSPLLEEIRLDNNQIRFIYTEAFQKMFRLKRLTLSGNRLIRLEKKLFHRLPSLSSLELRGNPWICDCMLRSFFLWQRELYLSSPPTCDGPAHVAGRAWNLAEPDEFACPPVFLGSKESGVLEIPPNGRARLICSVSGDPQPRLSWTYRPPNSSAPSPLLPSSSPRLEFQTKPVQSKPNSWHYTLLIEKVSPEDAGVYMCTGQNRAGVVTNAFTLQLKEPEREEAPETLPGLIEVFNPSTQTLWLGGAVTVVVLIGLCALCLLCCLAKRRREKAGRGVGSSGPTYVSVNGYGYHVVQDGQPQPEPMYGEYREPDDAPSPRPLQSLAAARQRLPDAETRLLGTDDSGYLEDAGRGSSPLVPGLNKPPLAQAEPGADMRMPLRETAL